MAQRPDVISAGAVVTRKGGDVLVVHRPRYGDWSFPKGKLDRGESAIAAAVREVGEETGLAVRLGPRLASQRYRIASGRMKTVHYWVGRLLDDGDISGYAPNKEIDEVRWVARGKVDKLLTYDYDRATLGEADRFRKNTRALVVLRHAQARSRKAWRQDDRLRPLLVAGLSQSRRLVPVLSAFGCSTLVSSSSARCVQTLAPYAEASGWPLSATDKLSEEDARATRVVKLLDELLHSGEPAVVCTHRPVLPTVFDALGVTDPKLEAGSLLVVHHRKGAVVATEQWPA
ncbi:MAG: NUDIX hydrolase [Nocardioidaceae bacterium]|nr:NUDIX hydrolase [Nocardioidaceae bacterium]